jgi:hypothetical protein
MAASEAAVNAVMEALDCHREVDRNGHADCEAHWYGWLSDVNACPRAERAANAAVDADRASIQAETLREAAQESWERGDIGKPDGGVEAWTWLRARADRIEGL